MIELHRLVKNFGPLVAVNDLSLSVRRGEFFAVLGPNADKFHHDHFHVDLARHGRDGAGRICK